MKEYDVWYNGTILGSVYATCQEGADAAVKEQFSKGVFGYPNAILA